MYVKLGFHNARLNLGRTVMAFIVIAAAAVIMTFSLATSSGFLHGEHLYLRYFLGADIAIFPGKFVFEPGALQEVELLRWKSLESSFGTELATFLPRLPFDGYFTNQDLALLNVAEVTRLIRSQPAISDTYPYLEMPAFILLPDDEENTHSAGMYAPLRARDLTKDAHWDLSFAAERGQGFIASLDSLVSQELAKTLDYLDHFAAHEGEMVCMLNKAAFPTGALLPQPGEKVTVLVPKFDGSSFNYDDLLSIELTVAGHYNIPVDLISTAEDSLLGYYWHSHAIHVPLEIWSAIASLGGVPEPDYVPMLGIMLEDTLEATRIAQELRELLPDHTVVTAPEMARTLRMARSQVGLPIDLDHIFHFMTLLITSSIVATNAFLLVMQRRREIAILKSLGAGHVNIIIMVISELAALALLASFAGFAGYMFFHGVAMAYNQVPGATIWSAALTMGWQVVISLTLSAIIFGFIPALKAARTPVTEVLNDA